MIRSRDQYYTTKEIAYLLGYTPDHVRRLILQGKIKAEKLGNSWLVAKKDLKLQRQRAPRDKEE